MIKCHTTNTYPCSYLPEQSARSEVVLPEYPVDTQAYGELIQAGFRRSGNYVYRPSCAHCQACVPARVNVNTFVPNRTQRRTWKQHKTLIAGQHALYYKAEHYALYQRYLAERHSGGGMDYDSREQYGNFLLQSNVNSRLVEFHEMEQLRMVSIIDILPDGLSSVYAFFDPAVSYASYGTYNILWQIHQCRELGLTYVYLGYWIRENRKMSYKANFQPLEILREGCWQRYNNDDTA